MCEKCKELREKSSILFAATEIGNRLDIEAKIDQVVEKLNFMGFNLIEKRGLKFCLNNTKYEI